MKPRKFKYIILLIALTIVYGCDEAESTPSNSLITGDQSTVDVFKLYEGPDIWGYSETVASTFNRKQSHHKYDIDSDGIDDFTLFYIDFKTIEQYSEKTSTIELSMPSMRVLVNEEARIGGVVESISWHEEGELIELNDGMWKEFTYGFTFFQGEKLPEQPTETRTTFPIGQSAYLVFVYLDSNNRRVMGWMQFEIGIGSNGVIPDIVDIGYKYVD